MRLRLRDFQGIVPRRSARLLDPLQAQIAQNCDLRSGDLRPWPSRLPVNTPTKAGAVNTIHRFGVEPDSEADGQITGVSNATPVEITSAGHGLTTGARVYIDGTGLSIDGVTYAITVTGANTFTLNGTSAAGTAATGTWARENGYWFHWIDGEAANRADVARGAIDGDTEEHTYYTGLAQPRFTYSSIAVAGGTDYPMAEYILGVPAPTAAPNVAAVNGTGDGNIVSHTWVYTYVATIGGGAKIEGPPSPASAATDVEGGQNVDLDSLQTGPGGNYNITHKRIYRSETGQAGTRYYFHSEIAVAVTTFNDTMADIVSNGAITSTLYDPPPTDLEGIIVLPNGAMAGFSKNRLLISPRYLPHAWPDRELTTESDIVAIAVDGQGVVVGTETRPYRFDGTDPASFTGQKLKAEQACVAKRSMVSLAEDGVLYASPDGLIAVSGATVRNVIEPWMTRKEWQTLKPQSIHAYYWDGRYVFFYDNDVTQGGYIFDPKEGGAGLTSLNFYADTGFSDPLSDSLYLLISGRIEKWAGGFSNLTYTWRSRLEQTPYKATFTCGQVIAETYSDVTFKLYADGVLKHTESVADDLPFRMPDGYRARQWEIEVTGTDIVQEVLIAETMAELGEV